LTHFIAAAVGRALRRIPEVDAVWDNEEIVTLGATDVGIAVDTERGLLVPVLRNAGSLPLGGVAAATTELVQRARDGRLAADDLQGGAISISNVGMFGASYLVPIVNPGQSAILGVAATKQVFRPDADGRPVLKQEMGLVLSCDHRLLDGVKAARFLDLVVRLLQQPLSLLMA
jgi:pyruvate dehydrogenase E2 component (dihydrolipoamide acetyltransferase)